MITFESFKVDLVTESWHFLKDEGPIRLWVNPSRDIMQQRLILAAPPDLTPDYPNRAKLRTYFEAMTKREGSALVGVDTLTIGSVEGFSTLCKFKNPKNPMGYRFLGTIMLTFEQFFCGFHFQSEEQGTTGEREAAIYMILKAQGKLPPEFAESEKQLPKVLDSMDEYFDAVKARPAMTHFSDDEQYDTAFPNHPLSRVRHSMKHLVETINFDDEVKRARPYHGPEWTPDV